MIQNITYIQQLKGLELHFAKHCNSTIYIQVLNLMNFMKDNTS